MFLNRVMFGELACALLLQEIKIDPLINGTRVLSMCCMKRLETPWQNPG